ncbi:hypothetical protein ACFY12_19240 [Streptomyces sp. NPDC001339]|uniref:hypothetical protein n=1 Tax=Streptomyces sp. NPDC001339 TaxID=3364563 RepID=UPI003675F971
MNSKKMVQAAIGVVGSVMLLSSPLSGVATAAEVIPHHHFSGANSSYEEINSQYAMRWANAKEAADGTQEALDALKNIPELWTSNHEAEGPGWVKKLRQKVEDFADVVAVRAGRTKELAEKEGTAEAKAQAERAAKAEAEATAFTEAIVKDPEKAVSSVGPSVLEELEKEAKRAADWAASNTAEAKAQAEVAAKHAEAARKAAEESTQKTGAAWTQANDAALKAVKDAETAKAAAAKAAATADAAESSLVWPESRVQHLDSFGGPRKEGVLKEIKELREKARKEAAEAKAQAEKAATAADTAAKMVHEASRPAVAGARKENNPPSRGSGWREDCKSAGSGRCSDSDWGPVGSRFRWSELTSAHTGNKHALYYSTGNVREIDNSATDAENYIIAYAASNRKDEPENLEKAVSTMVAFHLNPDAVGGYWAKAFDSGFAKSAETLTAKLVDSKTGIFGSPSAQAELSKKVQDLIYPPLKKAYDAAWKARTSATGSGSCSALESTVRGAGGDPAGGLIPLITYWILCHP